MAQVDASIYGQLKQPDPLGAVKDILDVQGKANQNRLTSMSISGQQQLGKAIQEATDPNGNVDQAKLGEILKRPENWSAAAAGNQYGVGLRGGQIANEAAGMGVANTGWNSLGTAWGARASRSQGDINPDDLRQDALDLLARGGMDPKQAGQIIHMIPSDPKQTRAFATGGFLQALGPSGMAAAAPAAPGSEGEPRQQTTGQFVTQSLDGGAPPATPPTPAAAPTAPATSGGVTTGIPPARAAALPLVGASATGASLNLESLAKEVPNRQSMLDQMLADQAEFTGGPASDELKTFISGVNEVFGTKFDVERVAAQERFTKLANQIALAQADNMNITDQRVQTTMGANPNASLSNLGIQGVIALLKGNEDAIKTKEEVWQDGKDAHQYHDEDFYKFSKDFNKHFDPRVFQSRYMDPTQWKQMVSRMPERDRNELRAKYNYAVEQGWIPDPRKQ